MKQDLRLSRRLALACVLLGAAAAASATTGDFRFSPDVELGEAPRREVPQDVTALPLLRAAPGTLSRDAVVALYNTVYVSGDLVALTWTGSVAGCNPGTTNLAHQQAVIDRVNYFRSLAGLPSVTLLGGIPTTQAQGAALMMSANNALSHSPPSNWICYTGDGATGAGKSNIALGVNGVDAIDLYVDDPGGGNSAAGHRRWILYPPQASIGTGDVARTNSANPPANDLYVFAPTTTRPPTPLGIAWPPAGYVPHPNLPSTSNRWSFSYPGANFAAASVTMSGPAGSLPVTLETVANGYGDNTIVFRPSGVSYTQPLADTTYTVTVSGIAGSGVPASFQYTVTVLGAGSDYSRNYVQKAYVAYYGRPAEPDGLGYWADRMDRAGQSLDAIIQAFGYSAEFNRRYGGLGYTQLVTKIYQQALARNPEQGGLNYYVGELQAGRRTLQTITLDVLNGATTAPDSTVVANKLDVAAYYSAKVAAGCPYGTEQDGVNALAGVTASPASVDAAAAAIDSRCGP